MSLRPRSNTRESQATKTNTSQARTSSTRTGGKNKRAATPEVEYSVNTITGHRVITKGRSGKKIYAQLLVFFDGFDEPEWVDASGLLAHAKESVEAYVDTLRGEERANYTRFLNANGFDFPLGDDAPYVAGQEPDTEQDVPAATTQTAQRESSPLSPRFSVEEQEEPRPPQMRNQIPQGHPNLGQTCWINSGMIMLRKIPPLCSALLRSFPESPSALGDSECQLLQALANATRHPDSQEALSAVQSTFFASHGQSGMVGRAYDASEFVTRVVQNMSINNCLLDCFDSMHARVVQTIDRDCGHSTDVESFPFIFDLPGWISGSSAQQAFDHSLASSRVDIRCPQSGCQVCHGTSSSSVWHFPDFLLLSIPRTGRADTDFLHRSPVLKPHGTNMSFKLIAELHYDARSTHYYTVAESFERLWVFNDSQVSPFQGPPDDEKLRSAHRARLLLYEKSDLASLFPLINEYRFPPPPPDPSFQRGHAASDDSASVGQRKAPDLGRVASTIGKAAEIAEKVAFFTSSQQSDVAANIMDAASLEELRQAAQINLEGELSVDTVMRVLPCCLSFCQEFLQERHKNIFLTPPACVLPVFSACFAFVYSGVKAAMVAKDSKALDVALAAASVFPIVLWRPDQKLDDLDFAKGIALKCVEFVTVGPANLIRDVKFSISCKRMAGQRIQKPSDMDQKSRRIETLIKSGDISGAAKIVDDEAGGFLPITDEVRDVIMGKLCPDKSQQDGSKTSRQEFLGFIAERHAEDFIPTAKMVNDLFKAKGGFKKFKVAGPDGLSCLHLSRLLAVHETRGKIIDCLRYVFGAVFSSLLSDDAAAKLYFANGLALRHKSGDIQRLKIVSIIGWIPRFAQKLVSRRLRANRLIAPVFRGIQTCLEKNGSLIGPLQFTSLIDQEAQSAAPNRNMAVVSLDVKSFYTSLSRGKVASSLLTLADNSAMPGTFASLVREYSNHLLTSESFFGNGLITKDNNGVIIGGASSTIFATLATAPLLRRAISEVPGLKAFYSYADNNNGLLVHYENADIFVDAINNSIKELGLECPPSSFNMHLPLYEGTTQQRQVIKDTFHRFKVSFGCPISPDSGADSGILLSARAPTDPSGIIMEGVPLGCNDFLASHLQAVADRACSSISKIVQTPGVHVASKILLITQSALPTVNYFFSVINPTISGPIANNFSNSLKAQLDLLLSSSSTSAQFRQLTLPTRDFGGFGFRSPSDYSAAAFINLNIALAKRNQIVHPGLPDAIDIYNLSVRPEDTLSIANGLRTLELSKLTAKDLTRRVYTRAKDLLMRELDPSDQARLQLAGMPSAGLWLKPNFVDFLNDTPADIDHFLDNKEYLAQIGLRLVQQNGSPVFDLLAPGINSAYDETVLCGSISRSTSSSCTSTIDRKFVHSCSCCAMHKYILHNVGISATVSMCTLAGLDVSTTNLMLPSGIRPDILISSEAPKLLIDFTVRSPYSVAGLAITSRDNAGVPTFDCMSHLKRAEDSKRDKYAAEAALNNRGFKTFAISSSGHFGEEANHVAQILASGLARRFFISHSEATKIVKCNIQGAVMKRISHQVVEAVDYIALRFSRPTLQAVC